ncbi:hypothetical protein ABZP36_035332 [Zizania latifolia]
MLRSSRRWSLLLPGGSRVAPPPLPMRFDEENPETCPANFGLQDKVVGSSSTAGSITGQLNENVKPRNKTQPTVIRTVICSNPPSPPGLHSTPNLMNPWNCPLSHLLTTIQVRVEQLFRPHAQEKLNSKHRPETFSPGAVRRVEGGGGAAPGAVWRAAAAWRRAEDKV